MNGYRAYGIRIASEISLPELPVDDSKTGSTADIVVRNRPGSEPTIPPDARCVYERSRDDLQVFEYASDHFWQSPTFGTLRVSTGDTITVYPRTNLSLRAIRSLVLGPGFRSVLVQRGVLVLHASAVAIDGIGVTFVGQSGAGKSTTAAAIRTRGHRLLSDDVTPVFRTDSDVTVRPGVSLPKLSRRVVAELSTDTLIRDSGSVRPDRRYNDLRVQDADDQHHEPQRADAATAVPLSRIYVLRWGDACSIEPARDPLTPVLRASYPLYSESDTDAISDHFRRCSTLVDTVPVRSLYRPEPTTDIDTLVSTIESDVTASCDQERSSPDRSLVASSRIGRTT